MEMENIEMGRQAWVNGKFRWAILRLLSALPVIRLHSETWFIELTHSWIGYVLISVNLIGNATEGNGRELKSGLERDQDRFYEMLLDLDLKHSWTISGNVYIVKLILSHSEFKEQETIRRSSKVWIPAQSNNAI